ncbi:hydrogenase maturation nickel metallochaperone HypA [Streptomyces decoyicus]|uniref:hydrogenase maturation nickel metallochaperone HypA n=1 Tax=Streptomyces decoyicus TaxID=249567 RepID=UPI0004AA344D|nr:hydrogenase maturation nickel metallochaperone HypA [Streptomyces decoyicus]KOG47963.1 hydrogenase nickel incorporation protein HypA [Streptomyces decoyicus]QZY19697.1 hydrogenase maturation nickel metallochaperone HypA [Streptomyces decoyicus]
MHEMSIALAVVEQVESAARPTGATTVNSVRLQVGELAGVVSDALAFSFELACAGTVLEGAELVTEPVPARARCGPCADTWRVGMPPQLSCPGCGGATAELLTGRELQIVSVCWNDAPVHVPMHEER